VVALIGLAIVFGHNVFDTGAAAEWVNGLGWAGRFIRPGAWIPRNGTLMVVAYPVIPWLGVMASGYGFGSVLLLPHHRRRKAIFALGLITTLLFVAVRALNGYGNPRPWAPQSTWAMTVASFLNCEKYPPSLLYVLMTIGPALMLLAWFDGGTGAIGRRLVTLGRVPLFFYILQWPVIRLLAVAVTAARGEPFGFIFGDPLFDKLPQNYGYTLGTVYLAWLVAVLILYFPCHWFCEVKRRRHDWWLSYL
jgi:uncharacterized membrane protein